MDKHALNVLIMESQPSPADFDVYLPWACNQLGLETTVQVTRVYQNEYTSASMTDRSRKAKSKSKLVTSRVDVATDPERVEKSESEMAMNKFYDKRAVKIQAVYDFQDNLVQIKFDKNIRLPRLMMKIIGLIIKFQTHLNIVTINSGLDQYTVYEICKFLSISHITDICLYDCYLKEPNYHLLLENANLLKYLSLCRCKIDDATVELLCSKLIYPLPASNTLTILNLSSNRISDKGAKYIAGILRGNRQLSYLNLTGNMITDDGAAAILNTLIEFPLTEEEVLTSKARYMTYLKNKNEMIASTITNLRRGDMDKRLAKRKSVRATGGALKKLKADGSEKSLNDPVKYLADVDIIEKAISIVENTLGDFADPYDNLNTIIRNGVTYSKGNNFLRCLNVSYNYLSYLSLRKIQSVLLYQKLEDRVPRGLLTVSVEGNYMPIACKELSQIDDILEINLIAQSRKLTVSKKRRTSKTPR